MGPKKHWRRRRISPATTAIVTLVFEACLVKGDGRYHSSHQDQGVHRVTAHALHGAIFYLKSSTHSWLAPRMGHSRGSQRGASYMSDDLGEEIKLYE